MKLKYWFLTLQCPRLTSMLLFGTLQYKKSSSTRVTHRLCKFYTPGQITTWHMKYTFQDCQNKTVIRLVIILLIIFQIKNKLLWINLARILKLQSKLFLNRTLFCRVLWTLLLIQHKYSCCCHGVTLIFDKSIDINNYIPNRIKSF